MISEKKTLLSHSYLPENRDYPPPSLGWMHIFQEKLKMQQETWLFPNNPIKNIERKPQFERSSSSRTRGLLTVNGVML
ncbi:MAG: hypothetical protein EBR81_11200 [Proteobacteria bacterium]|nr:hypothetical protein [Pseudomonadota bacterium]